MTRRDAPSSARRNPSGGRHGPRPSEDKNGLPGVAGRPLFLSRLSRTSGGYFCAAISGLASVQTYSAMRRPGWRL